MMLNEKNSVILANKFSDQLVCDETRSLFVQSVTAYLQASKSGEKRKRKSQLAEQHLKTAAETLKSTSFTTTAPPASLKMMVRVVLELLLQRTFGPMDICCSHNRHCCENCTAPSCLCGVVQKSDRHSSVVWLKTEETRWIYFPSLKYLQWPEENYLQIGFSCGQETSFDFFDFRQLQHLLLFAQSVKVEISKVRSSIGLQTLVLNPWDWRQQRFFLFIYLFFFPPK